MSAVPKRGWQLAAMNDPSGRRGIWYRVDPVVSFNPLDPSGRTLKLWGGREGDDYSAVVDELHVGSATFEALVSILETGSWMLEESGIHTGRWCDRLEPTPDCLCPCTWCLMGHPKEG